MGPLEFGALEEKLTADCCHDFHCPICGQEVPYLLEGLRLRWTKKGAPVSFWACPHHTDGEVRSIDWGKSA